MEPLSTDKRIDSNGKKKKRRFNEMNNVLLETYLLAETFAQIDFWSNEMCAFLPLVIRQRAFVERANVIVPDFRNRSSYNRYSTAYMCWYYCKRCVWHSMQATRPGSIHAVPRFVVNICVYINYYCSMQIQLIGDYK